MAGIDFQSLPAAEQVGEEMHDLIRELFPICRSITGDGLRRTLELIGMRIPLVSTEVPTGTQVLDWTIPRSGISPGPGAPHSHAVRSRP